MRASGRLRGLRLLRLGRLGERADLLGRRERLRDHRGDVAHALPGLLGARPLLLGDEVVGYWVRTRPGARPVAVHAAWQTDAQDALQRSEERRAAAEAGLDDLLPGPSAPPARRVGTAPRARGDRGGRHLGVWNPLDGPPAAPEPPPAPVPVKARVSFRLPADLVETARDAVAHLAGTADQTTLTALTERALRVELARLAITHNHGQPFPPRDP